MWKGLSVLILALLAINWHYRFQSPVEVPKLSDEYWGPGKPVLDPKKIKPFKISVSKEIIDDLNIRLDRSKTLLSPLQDVGWNYGISTTYLKTILNYWREKYNWNQRQVLLNKYPQFKTIIQGLDIHFYHVKPTLPKDRNVRVLPLLMVHGWPGSVVEFQKIIPMLTTLRSGNDFVFELVLPSLPGYGFSSATSKPGLGYAEMAVVLKNLMSRLGYEKFYTQGGDWGSLITTSMALLYPESVIGAHLNMCCAETAKSTFLTLFGTVFPSLIVNSEHHSKMYPLSYHFSKIITETGYLHVQATKPDTIGVGLTDSPAGLAAYILEKFSSWTNYNYINRDDGGLLDKFTLDELLDNIMVYWVTGSITSSQRLYAETFNKNYGKYNTFPVEVPTACAQFPHELIYQSETVLSGRYPNIIQFTHPPRGGHFAAFEEPELLASDIWSFVHKREQLSEQEKKLLEKQKSTDL